jgi:hypothetical protein
MGQTQQVVPPRSAPSSARVLYVVARDRIDLHAGLLDAFVDSARLTIVLDRRDTSRAVTTTALAADRRRLFIDEALGTRGWARVRIPLDGHPRLTEEAR